MTLAPTTIHTEYSPASGYFGMRKENVEQIKTFLRDTPNFKDRLEEMRLNALISGATEEEFEEAVKQLAPDALNSPLPKKLRPYTKKLIAVDAVVHVLFIVFAIASVSVVATLMNSRSFPHLLSQANEQSNPPGATKKDSNEFIPTVYANSQTLDGAKVFSFPGSNITLQVTGTPKREVLGFLPYWMITEQQQIDFTGLTTISFFGLEMDGGGNIVTRYDDGQPDHGWEMWNEAAIDAAIKRAKKQRIKTQVTLKAFNNDNIEQLVSSDEAQRTFIANAVHLVNTKALDGLTLDFEYIGTPDTTVSDNFTRFITNLSTEMKRQNPEATLSLATYVNAAAQPGLFDIERLSEHVDDFVIMGYDFHTPKGPAGPIAPMEGNISMRGFLQSYLEKVPAEKLVLALAHYGYDWPIQPDGKTSGYAGMLSYAEVAAMSQNHTISWDETAETPYFQYTDPESSQQRIVHYENTRSLGIKYDYVNEKNLKGVGIWALGYDGMNNDLRSLLLQKFAN